MGLALGLAYSGAMGDLPSDTPTFEVHDAMAETAVGSASSVNGRSTAFPERYHDRDSLGRGGMGEVRRCDDTVIGRDVALKAMHPGGGPDSRQRFLREARLQARLEHPSIVPVYDMGTDTNGNPWFTMRRIGGETLEEVLAGLATGDPQERERHGRRQLLGIFVRVCQAVAYAHRHGVLHRDIKPSNIIVTDDGGVYLLDWGIAKLREPGAPEPGAPEPDALEPTDATGPTTPLTAEGSFLGTLGYMPPEQLAGGGAAIDCHADIYALGATLYELLTLEPLHPRQSPPQLVAATLDGADARASRRVPAADVPPELEAVCIRATATKPNDRYPDVPALVDAIEAYLDGDRDLQQRRARAELHAAQAEQLAASSDLDGRAAAMREAGRALAFDPDSIPALRVITQLMLEPPPELPPEIARELLQVDAQNSRAMAKSGTYARYYGLVVLVLLLWMGVRSWTLWSLYALLSIISVVGARNGSKKASGHGVPLPIQIGNAVMLGVMATIVGPFLVVPALATASAALFAISGTRNDRLLTVLACAPMLVPFALEQLSLSPVATTHATGDALTIQPWMVSLPALPTYLLLTVTSIISVMLVTVTLVSARTRMAGGRREQLLRAWHLRQLVPHDRQPRETAA